jgi:hypothetical protein
MNRNHLAFLSMVVLAGAPSFALAESTVAMMEDVVGASQAGVAPYTEVAAGTSIALGSEGSIKFVHYQTCREVAVKGGNVTINAADYKVTGGTATETTQPCPQQVRIASNTAVSGGLVMRGGNPIVTPIASHPSLIVAGKNASLVTSVLFVDDAGQATEVPVKDNRAALPADKLALKQDGNYKLLLKGNGKTQLELPIRVVADQAAALTVLHVD